jgi:excisionase family DNA binding protein
VDGSVVVVPARVAAWLDQRARLSELRIQVRGADPEVDAVLVALRVAAVSWRNSATGTDPRNQAAAEPPSAWLSTTQAADELDMTDRGVRTAIASGRLNADRDGDRWRISREDFEHFRAARRAA